MLHHRQQRDSGDASRWGDGQLGSQNSPKLRPLAESRDWSKLEAQECKKLLGVIGGEGGWALLGNMRGAVTACSSFEHDPRFSVAAVFPANGSCLRPVSRLARRICGCFAVCNEDQLLGAAVAVAPVSIRCGIDDSAEGSGGR